MYLAFDTETTGVLANSNLLTVFFIVLDASFNQIDTLDIKLKHSQYVVTPKALEVNGIDIVRHDKEAIVLSQARSLLLPFLRKHTRSGKLIPLGHNITFDIGMLKSSGLLSELEYKMFCNFTVIDTIVFAQILKASNVIPKTQSLSLMNLIRYFGIDTTQQSNGPHNAEYDINMTVKLFCHMQKCMQKFPTTSSTEEPTERLFKKRKIGETQEN
jgi:DNA polymerase III epsilon subunit-like protein